MNPTTDDVGGGLFGANAGQASSTNYVMNTINLAAQRFFSSSDDAGSLPNPAVPREQLTRSDAESETDFSRLGEFQQLEIGERNQSESETGTLELTQREQEMLRTFRLMREEIMKLQRENRSLTRQLSISQHELRTVNSISNIFPFPLF
jgi:hypothetical protein